MSESQTDADGSGGDGATARMLLGLSALAILVGVAGFVVIWSLTYGPFG